MTNQRGDYANMQTGHNGSSPLVQRILIALTIGGAGQFLTAVAFNVVWPKGGKTEARIGPDCLDERAVRSLVANFVRYPSDSRCQGTQRVRS